MFLTSLTLPAFWEEEQDHSFTMWSPAHDHIKDFSLLLDLLSLSLASLPSFLTQSCCSFGYIEKHLKLKWDRLKAQWHATYKVSFSPTNNMQRGDPKAQEIQRPTPEHNPHFSLTRTHIPTLPNAASNSKNCSFSLGMKPHLSCSEISLPPAPVSSQ